MAKSIRAALAVSLVLGALSCSPRGKAGPPGGDGGTGAGAQQGAGVQLRYAVAPAKLTQTAKFDMSTSGGGQFGEAALQFSAQLELVPQGDKLKVVWSFAGIDKLDLEGMFASKDAASDPKAMLVAEGKGAFIVDGRGQLDEAASKALTENVARRKRFEELTKGGPNAQPDPGLRLLAFADAMIVLPDLPEQGLEVGKPVTVNEEEETELGESGTKLPTETETKYTLVKIDESGGKRIAELQVDGVSSGAAEMQGAMLTVDATTEGSMLFDLDAKLPVSYRFTRTQSFGLGQTTFESTMIIEASFAAAS